MNFRRTFALVSMAGSFGILAMTESAFARAPEEVTYQVTVQNVTAGNVLSPFLAFVAAPDYHAAQLGTAASPGVAALAETGDRSLLTAELASSGKALPALGAEGGPIFAGDSRSVELTVPFAAFRNGSTLNVLAMIGRSNDSFIRLGELRLASLPGVVGKTVVINARNYDAGSEENTGNVEDFGSGGHPTEAAEGHVSIDRGLNPRGTAPDLFAWGTTAAVVSITRIR